MEKIVIALMFVLVGMLARGQEYVPLVNFKSSWNILHSHINSGQTLTFNIGEQIVLDDTIYYQVTNYINEPNSQSFLKSGLPYLREDTLNKKVYLRELSSSRLLYDFGLQVGDTVVVGTCLPWENSFFVNSIDTFELLNGEIRKRWHLHSISYGEEIQDTWIEGIGSIKGLLYSGCEGTLNLSTQLLCFDEEIETLFQNQEYDECIINYGLNVDNIMISVIQVLPNPVRDRIYFHTDTGFKIGKVEILTLDGKIILSAALNTGNTIDISFLAKGVYIVKVFSENYNSTIKHKIVKL